MKQKKFKLWNERGWWLLMIEGNPSLYTCRDQEELTKLKDKLIK